MSGESIAENGSESRPESFRHEYRKTPKRAFLMGACGLVLGLFAGYSIGAESIPPAALPIPGSARTLQQPTEDLIPGDGTFLVGTEEEPADVQPGLYRSSGNVTPCTWRRAKDATGESDSIIARDTSLGDAYVQLQGGEFFDSTDCTTWRRVPSFAEHG